METKAAIEAMLMTAPFEARRASRKDKVTFSVPSRLTRIAKSQVSRTSGLSMVLRGQTPALLTSTDTRPWSRPTLEATSRQRPVSVTSSW